MYVRIPQLQYSRLINVFFFRSYRGNLCIYLTASRPPATKFKPQFSHNFILEALEVLQNCRLRGLSLPFRGTETEARARCH